jgi:hypothetical protein
MSVREDPNRIEDPPLPSMVILLPPRAKERNNDKTKKRKKKQKKQGLLKANEITRYSWQRKAGFQHTKQRDHDTGRSNY